MTALHIGIDDTDSPRIGCTTYVASLIVEKLTTTLGVSFIDYPNLVRLNPNVPWKTRGNGALCLRLSCTESQIEEVKEIVVDTVEENSDLAYAGTEPGVVFYFGDTIPEKFTAFAKEAIQGIVRLSDAVKLIKAFQAEAVGFKTQRGIIGALAAIGEDLKGDHTYELIAYRTPQCRGTQRQLDPASVAEMDKKTRPLTFNNVDSETGRILITPHGPDPILYGIRGETASIVKRAGKMVKAIEPIERWTIFRTNHGTDAHLRRSAAIEEIHPFNPVIVKGTLSKTPSIIPRRHVIFAISDETAQVDCAAYEPTGELRKTAQKLLVGDVIEAHGGVRPPSKKRPMTLNLEKLKILALATKTASQNPLCPQCGRRMESMGSGKGFRCPKCGFRSMKLEKSTVEKGRDLKKDLYVTSPRSQRHLTKPLNRYGLEKSNRPDKMISNWFWVNKSVL
jgi:tRNA(Ile2)-agmatinylcytidine synthase